MADGHHHRGRRAAVVALLLIGALLTPVALLAHWARDTITSTDGYLATVDTLAADPAVRSALVDHLTAVTLEQVDADTLVSAALEALGDLAEGDPRVDALDDQLRAATESLVRDAITGILDSDAFAAVWTQANRSAHTAAVALLTDDDDGGGLSLDADGQVTLDLAPVLDLVRAELVAHGITVAASIPQIETSIPLFSSQELVEARTAYTVLDAVAVWAPWVAALLLVAAVALARSRAVVLAWEAGAVVALTALTSLAVVVAGESAFGSPTGSPLRAELTAAIADILRDSAVGALRMGYVIGAVLFVAALAAWLVGRRRQGGRSHTSSVLEVKQPG